MPCFPIPSHVYFSDVDYYATCIEEKAWSEPERRQGRRPTVFHVLPVFQLADVTIQEGRRRVSRVLSLSSFPSFHSRLSFTTFVLFYILPSILSPPLTRQQNERSNLYQLTTLTPCASCWSRSCSPSRQSRSLLRPSQSKVTTVTAEFRHRDCELSRTHRLQFTS